MARALQPFAPEGGIMVAYAEWLGRADSALRGELLAMEGDAAAIGAAFGGELSFGTGGLRGTMGPGPARMNVHTVGRAARGLALWLLARSDAPRVAIAYDTRENSRAFAQEAAGVLAASGVGALLYPRPEPTPALSWAVRELGCDAGIAITASHNPREWNGFKVYGPDGCQATEGMAAEVAGCISGVEVFGVPRMPLPDALASGSASWIPDAVLEGYVSACAACGKDDADVPLKVAYTPLHGAGLECAMGMLSRIGVDAVAEPAQSVPDGTFPTCPKPNPEERAALGLGLALARREGTDLMLATDPDADRVAAAVPEGGAWRVLSGDEMGLLLADWACRRILEEGGDPAGRVLLTTVVSSPLADALAESHGLELRRTLTGFKWIGEQVGLLEREGRLGDFLMGFEESCGCLVAPHARDKDSVSAMAAICSAARYWRRRGMGLSDALEGLYSRLGHCRGALASEAYPGPGGAARMAGIMASLRAEPPSEVAGLEVLEAVDYSRGAPMPVVNPHPGDAPQALPPADMVELRLAGGSRLIARPSGTEPKAKAYAAARAESAAEAEALLGRLSGAAASILKGEI